MRWNRIATTGASILLAEALLAAVQWQTFQHLADTHETVTVRRINRLADKLLGEARRTKDDILLQQTVQAIALMPGVYWAAIVDPQSKILAHSDPSQLGKILHPRTRGGQWMHVLEDGRQEWGKFVFGFSDASFRRMAEHETVWPVLLVVMAGLLIFGAAILAEKSRQMNEARIVDDAALLEEEKSRSARLEMKVQQALSEGRALIQGTVNQIPEATLVLDSQQRVAALNGAALSRLGISRMEDALHKSWHEIPLLQSCGARLEQSIHFPMTDLEASTPTEGLVLSLTTLKDGLGTWMTFFPSKRIVK
jgi:PAS domain-containing protein